MKKTVSVIGLGRIGLPTALLLKDQGHDVIGVDSDPAVLKKIQDKTHLAEEPGIASLYQKVELILSEIPKKSDIYLVAVPTPLNEEKKSDLSFVYQAVNALMDHAKKNALVIIESTCPIGTTDQLKQKFPHLLFAYCPERVIPGNLLHELIHNDRIIGGTCEKSTRSARQLYQTFIQGKIHQTKAKTAEGVKLIENTFRDVNIAFANELSMLADTHHLSIREMIELANYHPRVNILTPGPGVGGHCLAVDPYFLMEALPSIGPSIIKTAREVNEKKTEWVIEKIKRTAKKNNCRTILCLGATYKENVSDFRESPALIIAQALKKDFCVEIIDPFYPSKPNLYGTLHQTDLIVGLVAHKTFKKNLPTWFKDKIFLDFAGVLG